MTLENTQIGFKVLGENQPVVYPSGKPRIPHLLRCQGFAAGYYSVTLGALDLRHPRFLQHWGWVFKLYRINADGTARTKPLSQRDTV